MICATRLDLLAVDGDVREDRRRRIVVVEEIVMHGLVVPDALAGRRIDAHDRRAVQVVAEPRAAIHVVGDAGRRQIHVAELIVRAHQRPDVAGAGVLPRIADPRLDRRRIVRGRHDVEGPAQLAGAHVVGAHVAGIAFDLRRRILIDHRRAHDDHVARDQRHRVPAIAGAARTDIGAQIDDAVLAEGRDRLAGFRIERVEIAIAERDDARVGAFAPIRHAAIGAAANRIGAGAVNAGLLHPDRLAGFRIERFGKADAVRGVEHAVDHDRRRAEVVQEADGRALQQARIDLRPAPGDLQRCATLDLLI